MRQCPTATGTPSFHIGSGAAARRWRGLLRVVRFTDITNALPRYSFLEEVLDQQSALYTAVLKPPTVQSSRNISFLVVCKLQQWRQDLPIRMVLQRASRLQHLLMEPLHQDRTDRFVL